MDQELFISSLTPFQHIFIACPLCFTPTSISVHSSIHYRTSCVLYAFYMHHQTPAVVDLLSTTGLQLVNSDINTGVWLWI